MKKLLLSCLTAMIMLTGCSNDGFTGIFTKTATGSVCIKKGEQK